MIQKMLGIGEQETEEHWVSISDVMAGLMVIFLFIAISYMLKVNQNVKEVNENVKEITSLKKDIKKHLSDYKNLKVDLSQELSNKFGEKLQKDLTIRFKNYYLKKSKFIVSTEFGKVLDNFFPQYIKILTNQKYKEYVKEIRIEGHTSSEWDRESEFEEKGYSKEDAAYLENMKLSQKRARKVLEHVLGIGNHNISPQDKEGGQKKDIEIITKNKDWIKKKLTANGLSSSKLILYPDGSENKEESRRVEFRVVTTSEKLIEEIHKLISEFDSTEVTN